MNKLMVKARCHNARDSTAFRAGNETRIDNNEGRKNKPMRLPGEHFAYGKPLRRSSPMREVIGNYYGELAEGEIMAKYDYMRATRSQFTMTAKTNMRRTKHTVKSRMAE